MDDLAGKLSDLLSNPEIMQQIQGLTGILGASENNTNPESAKEESSTNNSLLGLPDDKMMNMILKIAPLMSKMNQDDKYSNFLHALRPLLHEPRQKKLDEASRILQLMRMIPILKSEGLF